MAARERLAYHFGRRLRALREARGLTSTAFARLIGVSPAWISTVETGQSTPNFGFLARAAEVLSVEVVDLFVFPEATPRHRLMNALGPTSFRTIEYLEAALARQSAARAVPPTQDAKSSSSAESRRSAESSEQVAAARNAEQPPQEIQPPPVRSSSLRSRG